MATTTYRDSTINTAASGTAVTVARPTGTTTGDLVVCVVHCNGTPDITDNNGSTAFARDAIFTGGATGLRAAVFTRRIVDGDPATYAFTLGSTQRWTAVAVTWQNPDATTIFDVVPTANAIEADTGQPRVTPTITTTTSNAIHCAVMCPDGSGNTITATPGGYTVPENGGTNQNIAFTYKVIASPGATGTQDFTITDDAESTIGISFAIMNGAPAVAQTSYQFFDDGDELPNLDRVQPVIESGDATNTVQATAADPWVITYPNASTGDLLLFLIGWDDSTTTATCTAPAGPNGETISSITGPVASASTEVRCQAFYTVATGTWTSSTLNFDPSASEQFQASVIRVPAGEFLASDPIGAASTAASAATNESNLLSPAFTAEITDNTGTLVLLYVSDADAITAPGADFTTIRNNTNIVGFLAGVRVSAVAPSESIAALTATMTSDSWCSLAFVVKPPAAVADGRTPLAAINTAITLDVDTVAGCSARVYNSGAATAEDTYQWQYRLNAGTWTNVTGSSNVVKALATADFADGADVPEYLNTTGAGTYISNNNAALETDGTLVLAAVLPSKGAFETHLNFQVVSGDVSDEDTVELRVVYEDGTAFDTYTQTPTITVNEEAGAQALSPSLYTDADTFYAPTVVRVLSPALYTDADTFYAPSVVRVLSASLYTDADVFYAPTIVWVLSPALFTDGDTFYAPTVSRGTITLSPDLYTDADTFYAPTVSRTVHPGLYTDDDTFYSPEVTATGATQTLLPDLYTDADTFYQPTVSRGTITLSPDLYTDADVFYAPHYCAGGIASLYTDGDTFYAPTVARGAVTLSPALYTDADVFYSPTVTKGVVTLSPALYSDADTFYAPTVARADILGASLYTDADTFYTPTVVLRLQILQPSLLESTTSLVLPTVSSATWIRDATSQASTWIEVNPSEATSAGWARDTTAQSSDWIEVNPAETPAGGWTQAA